MGNEGTKSRRGGYPGQNASYPPADGHEDSGRIATSLLKKARRAAHVRWLPPCLSQKHYLGAITHAYTTCKSPISEHLVRCLHSQSCARISKNVSRSYTPASTNAPAEASNATVVAAVSSSRATFSDISPHCPSSFSCFRSRPRCCC